MNEHVSAPRVIDLHGHLLPHTWLSEIQADGSAYGIEVDTTETTDGEHQFRLISPDGASFNVFSALWDEDDRISKLDDLNVTAQLVAPPTPALLYQLPRGRSQAVARLYNETISDIARNSHGRLIPAATLPMSWPKVAVTELEYAVEVLGIPFGLHRDKAQDDRTRR